MTVPRVRAMTRIAWLLFSLCAFVDGCAATADRLAVSDKWDEFKSRVGNYDITYKLPHGDDYSPYPVANPKLSAPSVALAGVAFGSRPQGQALADALFALEIRRLDPIPSGKLSADELMARLNAEEEAAIRRGGSDYLSRVVSAREVGLDGRDWVYRERIYAKTRLPWGDEYCIYLDNGLYLVVNSMLWPHAGQDGAFVSQSASIVRAIAESVTITEASPSSGAR